jgi:hypothetical protein
MLRYGPAWLSVVLWRASARVLSKELRTGSGKLAPTADIEVDAVGVSQDLIQLALGLFRRVLIFRLRSATAIARRSATASR